MYCFHIRFIPYPLTNIHSPTHSVKLVPNEVTYDVRNEFTNDPEEVYSYSYSYLYDVVYDVMYDVTYDVTYDDT